MAGVHRTGQQQEQKRFRLNCQNQAQSAQINDLNSQVTAFQSQTADRDEQNLSSEGVCLCWVHSR
jgi:hypothetical protein